MQHNVQQGRKAGTFRSFERHFVPTISEGQFAAMPSYGSCHQYRTVCSNVEKLGSSCPLRSTPALMPPFCSCYHRRYNCSNAIILFLPSMQHNVQQCRKAGTFRSFEERFGSDVIILFSQSEKVNLQECRHMVLAITTGQFAAMSQNWYILVL